MAVTTVPAEVSQCIFEFLHMEIVSRALEEAGEGKKVRTGLVSYGREAHCASLVHATHD